jgi:hypothetical protein
MEPRNVLNVLKETFVLKELQHLLSATLEHIAKRVKVVVKCVKLGIIA